MARDTWSSVHQLTDTDWEKQTLSAVLEHYYTKLQSIYPVPVQFQTNEENKNLPIQICDTIKKAGFELVNNAIRHSRPSQIQVYLESKSSRVSLTVRDNGKGFDREKAQPGFGLQSLTAALEQVQGTISFESLKPNGTESKITVPMEVSIEG